MRSNAATALLALASTVLLGGAVPDAQTYVVQLTGEAEIFGAASTGGDEDGSGLVRLTVDPDDRRICYDFKLAGLATPLMAHIHRAPATNIGPSVVTLFTGPVDDLRACRTWTEERLAEIVEDPSNFYVNVYTTEYPDGALRGQLLG